MFDSVPSSPSFAFSNVMNGQKILFPEEIELGENFFMDEIIIENESNEGFSLEINNNPPVQDNQNDFEIFANALLVPIFKTFLDLTTEKPEKNGFQEKYPKFPKIPLAGNSFGSKSIYVCQKQFHRIVRVREKRQKGMMPKPAKVKHKRKKEFINYIRHKHATKRKRNQFGQFT